MKKNLVGIVIAVSDIILINMSIFIAFLIRWEGSLSNFVAEEYLQIYLENILAITIIKITIFYIIGLYKSLWKYASIEELLQIVGASFIANAGVVSYMFIIQNPFPRSIYFLTFMLDVLLIGGVRFSSRVMRRLRNFGLHSISRKADYKRVMIIGAGQAGAVIIKELRNHENLKSRPVAIIDDDRSKIGSSINGVPVMGDRGDIRAVAEKKGIDEIIIAIPSGKRSEIREIVEEASRTRCRLKIVPGIYELIDGKVSIKKIRDVDIEDLLGREPVKVDLAEISEYLHSRVVLITGGGGSIGSELCRQIAGFRPRKLIIFDNYENGVFDIQNELAGRYRELDLDVLIGSIRDMERVEEVFKEYMPEVVFHAAAHKHVPLMEGNPREAVKNNIFGTKNVADCAHKYGTRKFVLVSTDKAVNPTNVMGATKRVAEIIIQSMNEVSSTDFVAVRFGNVLGSNGSVIPLFKRQISEGGPVTVTHPEVQRYFMTIPEAVQLIIQAGAIAEGGEIFVLDMGVAVKIMDLARNLILLSGFEPDKDIKIEITGLRPGEKLFEELLMKEEGLQATKHEKIYIGKPVFADFDAINRDLETLGELLKGETCGIINQLAVMVPTYKKAVG